VVCGPMRRRFEIRMAFCQTRLSGDRLRLAYEAVLPVVSRPMSIKEDDKAEHDAAEHDAAEHSIRHRRRAAR